MTHIKPSFQDVVRHFPPSWFALVMGTAVAVPAVTSMQKVIPFAEPIKLFFLITAAIEFFMVLIPWVLRWLWFPGEALESLKHPVSAAFVPALPISLVIGGIALEKTGSAFMSEGVLITTLQSLLVLGSFGILILAIIILAEFFHKTDLPWGAASLGWLIPPVSTLIVPLLGFSMADHTAGSIWQKINLFGSLIFSGLGFFLFMFMMGTVFTRYLFHPMPPAQLTPTFWIGVAPTSILSIISIKSVPALALFFAVTESVSQTLGFLSIILSIGLWGFAFFWLLLALWFTFMYVRKSSLDFALSWWAFIFPLGAFVVATGVLFSATGESFFLTIGLFFLLMFFTFWVFVFFRTLQGIRSGKLFFPHN